MKTTRAAGPHVPPIWDTPDIAALQAMQRGDATEYQQRRALDWIIKGASATYELSYQPESDRATAFAEGRRFVGLQIVKMLSLDISMMKKGEN